jgi:hypothetical protein
VTIDESSDPTPAPEPAARLAESNAARLALAAIGSADGSADGMLDYTAPLDPDLQLRDFATPTLRAIDDEVCLQGHLLVMGFVMAVESRFGTEAAVEATDKQFTGVAGVVAERLCRAFGLGAEAPDVATVFSLHPAFRPGAYVDWDVAVDGDVVRLRLGDCPATAEHGFESWMTLLADGRDRALSAVAAGVDPHWAVHADRDRHWVVERTDTPATELPEVAVTRFSTGVKFGFDR